MNTQTQNMNAKEIEEPVGELEALKKTYHAKFQNEHNNIFPRVQSSQEGAIIPELNKGGTKQKKPLKISKDFAPTQNKPLESNVFVLSSAPTNDKQAQPQQQQPSNQIDQIPNQKNIQNTGMSNSSTIPNTTKSDDAKSKVKLSTSTSFTPPNNPSATLSTNSNTTQLPTTNAISRSNSNTISTNDVALSTSTILSTTTTIVPSTNAGNTAITGEKKAKKPLAKSSKNFAPINTGATPAKEENPAPQMSVSTPNIATTTPTQPVQPTKVEDQPENAGDWGKGILKVNKQPQSPDKKQVVSNGQKTDQPAKTESNNDTSATSGIIETSSEKTQSIEAVEEVKQKEQIIAAVEELEKVEIQEKPVQVQEKSVQVQEKPVEIQEKPVQVQEKPVQVQEELPKAIVEIVEVVQEETKPTSESLPTIPEKIEVTEPIVETKPEPQIQPVARVYSREEMLKIIQEFQKTTLTDQKLIDIKNREISIEEPQSYRKSKVDKSKQNTGTFQKPFEKGPYNKPNTQPEQTLNRNSEAPKVQESTFVRQELTPEELALKMKIKSQANVWMSEMKKEKDPLEAIEKEIRLALNKLTPDNFEKIKDEILKLASSSFEACVKTADLILEKAWTEKNYCKTYSKLCDFLGKSDKLSFAKKDEIVEKKNKKNDFKLQIFSKIQKVFQDESAITLKSTKKPEDMTKEEKDVYYMKKKQKILGNVNFIAQLFIEKFFILQIVRICTTSLLSKFLQEYATYIKDPSKIEFPTHEDNLEGLVKFYEQIGEIVSDKEKAKDKTKKDDTSAYDEFVKCFQTVVNQKGDTNVEFENESISLEDFFKVMDYVRAKGKLSSRMQALIQNLEFRRQNNWVIPDYHNQGPKTIKEIHEEYAKERNESEKRALEFYEDYPKKKMTTYEKKEYIATTIQSDEIQKARDTKIYQDKDVDVPTKIEALSFKPKRGKNTNTESAPVEKPKLVVYGADETEKLMKEIYKQTEPQNIPKTLANLITKTTQTTFLNVFFKTFHDDVYEIVMDRIPTIKYMLEKQQLTDEEFISRFAYAMEKSYDYDSPRLPTYMAIIFLDYVRISGKMKLSDINFENNREDWEIDMIREIYDKFIQSIREYLKGDYSDMENKIQESDFKILEKKLSAWTPK